MEVSSFTNNYYLVGASLAILRPQFLHCNRQENIRFMNEYAVGQRWLSETETDLGLGIIQDLDYRLVTIFFPAVDEERTYAKDNAPLSRVRFSSGDEIELDDGQKFEVLETEERAGMLFYQVCTDQAQQTFTAIVETQLNHTLNLKQAEDRLFSRQIDSPRWFELRYAAMSAQESSQRREVSGLSGARVDLIPHQLYIANEVGKRFAPRVLLADEVGLGKTIEAGLIIHQQLISSRAQRVLIVVPKALTHQWFVEMYRRFNLHFSIFDAERISALLESGEETPFVSQQLVLCSLDFLVNETQQSVLDAEWDLLIVDEAHHLDWHEQEVSPEYEIIEKISQKAKGLLLLTATPEQLGQEGHFARLRLLDPERFQSLEKFVEEQASYQDLADLVVDIERSEDLSDAQRDRVSGYLSDLSLDHDKDTVISELLDQNGTGRVLFRNTRKNIEGFPKRIVFPYPLSQGNYLSEAHQLSNETDLLNSLYPESQFSDDSWCLSDPRAEWLSGFLRKNSNHKVLVICAMKNTAMDLELFLRYRKGFKTGVFHEDLDLVSRDRAAAYFADDDDGAQVLVCSEIGSEGRNFQFASHLVLFDLPIIPDLLEQRIGRLDRIGQKEDIKIHVPYIETSAQEVLFNWYHSGIDAFEHTNPAGEALYLHCEPLLLEALASPEEAALQKNLLTNTMEKTGELKATLEGGRDRLLELSSYDETQASALVSKITEQDQHNPFEFMEQVFDRFGVNSEPHSLHCTVVEPGDHMFTPSFPGLPEDGITVTFDRQIALAREDMAFLTWEHPMVMGAIEMVLSQDKGNACVCLLKNKAVKAGTLLLEVLFKLESVAPKELQAQRFLPSSVVRVLVDMQGRDLSEKVSHENINKQCHKLQKHIGRKVLTSEEKQIKMMLEKAKEYGAEKSAVLTSASLSSMNTLLESESERLNALKLRNANVRDDELSFVSQQQSQLNNYLSDSRCQLDAVRVIISSP